MRIISAPFGLYLRRKDWIPTIGTFTPQFRGGLAYRLWRRLRTLRYSRQHAGWVNKLGLPNPGREWLAEHNQAPRGCILSLGVASDDTPSTWEELLYTARACEAPVALELNLSCPNEERGLTPRYMLTSAKELWPRGPIYAKLPPVDFEPLVDLCLEIGIYNFHACNTIPTPYGGLSGPSLRPLVRLAIEYVANRIPTGGQIIAGGGIQNAVDAQVYLDLGADHVAVGSAWLNPLNWRYLDLVPKE